MIQDIKRDVISRTPIHIDFLFVDEKHEVEHEVPIELVGEAPAVKEKDGVLDFTKREIKIKALPQNIPPHITVDISGMLEIGNRLTIKDIEIPKNVSVLDDINETVISIVAQAEDVPEEVGEIDFDSIKVEEKGKKPEEEEPEDK